MDRSVGGSSNEDVTVLGVALASLNPFSVMALLAVMQTH